VKCETLDVWKRSSRLSVNICKYFKESKDYSFKDQITRAGLSIPSNIAEGFEKESDNEKIRYIEIAKGSSAELITQIYIGIEIEYIDKATGLEWVKELNDILRMLTGLKSNYESLNT
jgi:four helix bundle protein